MIKGGLGEGGRVGLHVLVIAASGAVLAMLSEYLTVSATMMPPAACSSST